MSQFIKTFNVNGHIYDVYNNLSNGCTKARAKVKGADWFSISSCGWWDIDSEEEYDDICEAITEMEVWRMEHGQAKYLN